MNTIIALIIIISNPIQSWGNASNSQITAYSIPGFNSLEACKSAKPIEVSRMQKIIYANHSYGTVSGKCVMYPNQ
jgi:hypothetical protein